MKGCMVLFIVLGLSTASTTLLAKERNWSDVWKELENISYQHHDIFEGERDGESFWQGVQYAEVEEPVELDLSQPLR